jgi:hypothetical protein
MFTLYTLKVYEIGRFAGSARFSSCIKVGAEETDYIVVMETAGAKQPCNGTNEEL